MTRYELPKIPPRTLILWTLGVIAVLGFFWLLLTFYEVVLLLVTALILSTAVRPAVRWLESRGLRAPLGLLLIFGVAGLLAAVVVWATVPVLAQQGSALGGSLREGYTLIYDNLASLPNILLRRLSMILPADPTLPGTGGAALPAAESDLTFAEALAQGRRLFNAFFKIAIIAVLTFYWTLEGEGIKQAALMLVPLPRRDEARELVREIEVKVGGYVLGQGLLSVIVGVMSFAAYSLIGLPHALLLGVVAGLLEAVPYLGPVLGAVPALLIGLSVSPATALWVALATVIIQQLENNLLVPRVMRRTIGVRPLVTLLALLAFGSLFGVLGALIALPLAAVVQLLLDHYLLDRESLDQPQTGRDRAGKLQYEANQLVQDVRSQVRRKESAPSAASDALEDELERIVLDLESFLALHSPGGGDA